MTKTHDLAAADTFLAAEGDVRASLRLHRDRPVVWLTYGPEADPERDTVSERALLEALAGLGLEASIGEWDSGTDSRGGDEDHDPTLCWAVAPVEVQDGPYRQEASRRPA